MARIQLIHEVRAAKTNREVANIIEAQRISERVLHYTVAKLRTGVSEASVVRLIKKTFVQTGASILSFSPIVAFGKNTANIHHQPGKTKLKTGDIIMFDFGTTVKHYCSDMTRTFFWGNPSARQKKIYLAVLRAQEIALRKLSKGEKKASKIDSSARLFLEKKYKNNFKHGLGHGVGTVIHEWPNFKPKSKDILPIGVVMTVEPGLYFEGFGGVRIEDMVLIKKKGIKNLTNFSKDLRSIILDPK